MILYVSIKCQDYIVFLVNCFYLKSKNGDYIYLIIYLYLIITHLMLPCDKIINLDHVVSISSFLYFLFMFLLLIYIRILNCFLFFKINIVNYHQYMNSNNKNSFKLIV